MIHPLVRAVGFTLLIAGLAAACTAAPADTEEAAALPPTAAPTAAPTEEPASPATEEPTSPPTLEPTAEPTEAPTAGPARLFTVYGDQPIVLHGPAGSWDGTFTDPGAVLFHEGQFHLFRNGFKAWPAVVGVAHHVSEDGLAWPENRVRIFSHDEVAFPAANALASSVLVEEDGTWVLYFYSLQALSGTGLSIIRIGRATAESPDGPFAPDPAPALEPGSPGAWDDTNVSSPSVIKTEDGYVMFYTGGGASARDVAIGMATSPDAVAWTRYDDPATTDTPYAESDPVFTVGEPGAWDEVVVHQPRVVLTPDGYVMLYRSHNGSGRDIGFGIAMSNDGIHWTRHPENPVLVTEDVPGARALWFSELVYADRRCYFYVEVGMRGGTDIWVATHEGPLP